MRSKVTKTSAKKENNFNFGHNIGRRTEIIEKCKSIKSHVTGRNWNWNTVINIVLKNCTEYHRHLSKSIDTRILPEDLLSAGIASLLKQGDVHAEVNNKPISLTYVSSNLLDHTICKHILEHLEKHNTDKCITLSQIRLLMYNPVVSRNRRVLILPYNLT